ncbi:unnamed protein product [Strongylus vulgaris]|uniref:Uncharacterized protein n=1 Tax=Strongylus vulgaris TaxID=40348 RepID=A0A3P7J9J7_STRVU|nr:unnamed protein product [Strongylus vulgaris]
MYFGAAEVYSPAESPKPGRAFSGFPDVQLRDPLPTAWLLQALAEFLIHIGQRWLLLKREGKAHHTESHLRANGIQWIAKHHLSDQKDTSTARHGLSHALHLPLSTKADLHALFGVGWRSNCHMIALQDTKFKKTEMMQPRWHTFICGEKTPSENVGVAVNPSLALFSICMRSYHLD